jgi:imidazolonepropionase-like amidohydrolase
MEKNERVRHGGLQALKIYKEAGVQIGYGSDLSMHTQQFQNEGLAFHATALSNADVIRSATVVNAKVIKREGKLGELVSGAHADLLVVKGDPYRDLNVLANHADNIVAIMQAGAFVKSLSTQQAR